jgi:hypothetical protein
MKRFGLTLALILALSAAGCAEVTKSVNGAGKTVDGWFSPNK